MTQSKSSKSTFIVHRVLQLTSSMVIPIMYQVPRKTYRDFHSDIFPDTNGYKSDLSPKDWLTGKNLPVSKISLDPAKRQEGEKPIIVSFCSECPLNSSFLNLL